MQKESQNNKKLIFTYLIAFRSLDADFLDDTGTSCTNLCEL